ncbi:MAG TPA: response regulator, partial [Deltaproteobacteria bacterium]|nr:response regulator [Deltaproteobacteria bacterium]
EVFLPRFGIDIAEEAGADETIPAGKGERILLVDDEPDIVKFAALMLEQLGYSVSSHTASQEALEALRSDPLAFDLVLTDQTMPNLRGDHLASAILKIRPDIPVVLMTGYSAVIDRESALELGIKAFIDKPFSSRTVAGVIRAALESRGGA